MSLDGAFRVILSGLAAVGLEPEAVCTAAGVDPRRRLAERLIADPRLDVGEIAGRVGFADPPAFGKAFRRWFGVSPSAFRARRSAG
jgi:AraC-like DNA-binding protein